MLLISASACSAESGVVLLLLIVVLNLDGRTSTSTLVAVDSD